VLRTYESPIVQDERARATETRGVRVSGVTEEGAGRMQPRRRGGHTRPRQDEEGGTRVTRPRRRGGARDASRILCLDVNDILRFLFPLPLGLRLDGLRKIGSRYETMARP